MSWVSFQALKMHCAIQKKALREYKQKKSEIKAPEVVKVSKGIQISVPKFKDDCLLSKGVEIQDLLRVREKAVLYVQPCASERGMLMADVELREAAAQFIDPQTLCSLLEIYRRRFAELKCSPSLGVAKLKWKGREIGIFKNGKLKIQRALDREEILRVANSVSRLIWGAAICEVCGQSALRCASMQCGMCTSEGKAEVQVEQLPNAELLVRGYSNLKKAFELEKLPAQREEFEKVLHTAQYLTLFFVIEAPNKEDAALGLLLLGEIERMKTRYDTHG